MMRETRIGMKKKKKVISPCVGLHGYAGSRIDTVTGLSINSSRNVAAVVLHPSRYLAVNGVRWTRTVAAPYDRFCFNLTIHFFCYFVRFIIHSGLFTPLLHYGFGLSCGYPVFPYVVTAALRTHSGSYHGDDLRKTCTGLYPDVRTVV